MKLNKDNLKHKNDEIDNILFKLAQEDYKEIPTDTHTNLMNTIQNLELNAKSNLKHISKNNTSTKYKLSFKQRFYNCFKKPIQTIAISCFSLILITSGAVGARQMSEKFFNKDNVRLENIGIKNEFIFTSETENALKQNVPFELIELNDMYSFSVQSILVDEINFFAVFELHSREPVTDDLRFTIRDLKIENENGDLLYNADNEIPDNMNKGSKNIYNTDYSIKEMFFMFGNDNSNIKNLNFSFSEIEIYRYNTQTTNTKTTDKNLSFENKNISITLTKSNYNTIQEYVWDKYNENSKYVIEKAILTNTGLYILTESDSDALYPIIEINKEKHLPSYNLPLKRIQRDKILMLFAYNIKENTPNIKLLNNLDNNRYNLIQKN